MRRYIGMVLLLLAAPLQAASFDCTKAKSPVEHRICANEELSQLDAWLDVMFRRVLDHGQNPSRIRHEQREWVKQVRGKCQSDECLAAAYQDRIAAFASQLQTRIYSDKALGIEFTYPIGLEVEKTGQSLYIQKRDSGGQVTLLVDIEIGRSIPNMVADYPIRGIGWTGFIQVKPCRMQGDSGTNMSGACLEADISDGKRHVSLEAMRDASELGGMDPGPILTSIRLLPEQ